MGKETGGVFAVGCDRGGDVASEGEAAPDPMVWNRPKFLHVFG
jgi:hypothetical protein